jgi:hypothetical protein
MQDHASTATQISTGFSPKQTPLSSEEGGVANSHLFLGSLLGGLGDLAGSLLGLDDGLCEGG